MQRESKANDGYIEISSLLRFNSIKKISTSMADVAASARTVESVVVSKDGEAIRRKDALPEDGNSVECSLFVAGLPVENVKAEEDDASAAAPAPAASEESAADATAEESETIAKATKEKKTARYTSTVADVRAIFEKYGEVALVRFRFSKSDKVKGVGKQALGSCFVEFKDASSVAKVVEAATAETDAAKFFAGEKEVYPKAMVGWLKEQKEKKDLKKGKAPKAEPAEPKPLEVEALQWKPGCVITLAGLPADCDREMLKEAFEAAGVTIDYTDFSRGETSGAVRVNEPNDTFKDVVAKLNSGEAKIGEATVEAIFLEGDVEEKYWGDAAISKAERKRARENEPRKGGNRSFGNKRQKGNNSRGNDRR